MRRFDNRVAQQVMAGFSVLILFIGMGGLSAPESRGQGAFFFLLGAGFLARSLTSSRVLVHRSGVETRSMLRTRHHAFADLSSVEVEVGRTGLNGSDREFLVLHRTGGSSVAFKELNCRLKAGSLSVVRAAAASIEERLASEARDHGG